jgi:hypothetical protein
MYRSTHIICIAVGCQLLAACGSGGGSSAAPPMSPDFSVILSSSSVSTQVGGTTTPINISFVPQNGFTGPVTVTLSGFPLGINSSPASPFVLTSATQQVTFSAPAAAGTFSVTFQGVSGALTRNTSATLMVTPQPTQYLVSAAYYPWYQQNQWVNQTTRGALLPPQLPALGLYDSQNQNVVTQQIAWSTAAGINVWDLEWIMPNDFEDATIQNTVLTNPHIGDIRFAIFYDYAQRFKLDFNLTSDKVATIVSDFQYIAAHFFAHPSYLKVGLGRPVVWFYAALQLTPVSAVQPMVSSLRQAMSNAGFDVYLIGDEYYASFPPDPVGVGNWDGIFGYDTFVYYRGYSDDNGLLAAHSAAYAQYQTVAHQLGVDFVPSLNPGYNDRVIRPTANNPALARRTSAAAAEGSMFASFLGTLALPYANNNRYKMIHITSFNEWHEDSQLEPSAITAPTTTDSSPTGSQYTQGLVYQGYGTTYMDIIRSAIAAAHP